MENTNLGVTQEIYLEICLASGNEPDPEQMPVVFEDFLSQTQKVFELYNILDSKHSMDGAYVGKSILGIEYVIKMLGLEEEFFTFYMSVIKLLDELYTSDTHTENKASGKKDS